METTYTDIEDGSRIDVEVEFVAQRTVDATTEHVRRLLVVDRAGEQFSVLATAESDPFADLKTGAAYRITGLLGSGPVAANDADGNADADADCPHCDGRLRRGRAVDGVEAPVAEAATRLELDEPFGVVDARAAMRRLRASGERADDWSPMSEEATPAVPEFVCESCDRTVAASALRGGADVVQECQLVENVTAAPESASSASSETVGLAAGGAKDVENFRENVSNGYTPQPEAISDEGLFYDYQFEAGDRTGSDALFAPRYAAAASDHPLTGETERFLSVGLDSTLSVDEFRRPRLDLVAVLDVSGSMDSRFDAYYYDEHGRRKEAEADDDGAATKIAAATQAICALTEQLRENDRLGVVLYNARAHVAKPLRDVATTDMPAIRRHVREIAAGGGTNLADGFEAAVDMLDVDAPDPTVERRVVFTTDMMPNTGTTGAGELTKLFADAAERGIHTTFVGMGLDANAELAETLSGIRGANHYFVNSAAAFERRLGEEFDYMVTPLVYDLALELEGDGYDVAAVHGSPSADAASDRLMHVGTLFPAAKSDGEARGGVVLVRLEHANEGADADLDLVASWTERGGGEHTERVTVDVPDAPETFAHGGVRKAVALSRYARALRAWAGDVHQRADVGTGVDDWLLSDQRGVHERESVPLTVPDGFAERFDRLGEYLETELEAVDDESMRREIELLETLCRRTSARPTGSAGPAEVSD